MFLWKSWMYLWCCSVSLHVWCNIKAIMFYISINHGTCRLSSSTGLCLERWREVPKLKGDRWWQLFWSTCEQTWHQTQMLPLSPRCWLTVRQTRSKHENHKYRQNFALVVRQSVLLVNVRLLSGCVSPLSSVSCSLFSLLPLSNCLHVLSNCIHVSPLCLLLAAASLTYFYRSVPSMM